MTTATITLVAHLPRNAHARLDEAPCEPKSIGSAKTLAGVQRLVDTANRLHQDYTACNGTGAARSLKIVVEHADQPARSFSRDEDPEWIWLYATDPTEWRRRTEAIARARAEQEAREDAIMARDMAD